jgi:hypothetical protein
MEGHPCWSKCGRRTGPFSGRAFREHRTNLGVLPILLSPRLSRPKETISLHPLFSSPLFSTHENSGWRRSGSPTARSGVPTPGGVRGRSGWSATGPAILLSLPPTPSYSPTRSASTHSASARPTPWPANPMKKTDSVACPLPAHIPHGMFLRSNLE